MTYGEFLLYVDGRSENLRDERRLLAWHAANIMSMWSKKPIKPSKLLGETRSVTDFCSTPEEVHDYLRSQNRAKGVE